MPNVTRTELAAQVVALNERAWNFAREAEALRLFQVELAHEVEACMDVDLLAGIMRDDDEATRIEDEASDTFSTFMDAILAAKHELAQVDSGEPDESDWTPPELHRRDA